MARTHPTTSQSSRDNKPVTRAQAFVIVRHGESALGPTDLEDVDVVSSFIWSGMNLIRPQKLISGDSVNGY